MTNTDKNFIDTYTLLTAENILHQLNTSLSKEQLFKILRQDDTFYKKILSLVKEYIINQQFLNYCEALDDFDNAEINSVSVAYQRFLNQNQVEQSASDPTLIEINSIKDQLNVLKFRRHKLTSGQQELLNNIKVTLKQHIEEWHALQKVTAQQLTEALLADDYKLPDDFQKKLEERLIYQDFELETIPDKALKDLNIKNRPPTYIEKALISLLF